MQTKLSFEFFPPRGDDGAESLLRVAEKLKSLGPEFVSVTYGAGGSTREGTRQAVSRLRSLGLDAAPHLSIGNDSEASVRALLDTYSNDGVRRIVALRGDVPSGSGTHGRSPNAEALVRCIRAHSGPNFHVEVAAYPEVHPEAQSPAQDLDFFKRKVEAGADGAITQYFYNPHAYFDFVARARKVGIEIPITPGIMPINNFAGIVRFSKSCGAEIPRWLYKQLEAYQDDEPSLRELGVEFVSRLCEDLLAAGAPGLHFYTLNRWGAASRICQNLGLMPAAA